MKNAMQNNILSSQAETMEQLEFLLQKGSKSEIEMDYYLLIFKLWLMACQASNINSNYRILRDFCEIFYKLGNVF